jgi:pimeloyl-ACP methyl ester carboxylesterase
VIRRALELAYARPERVSRTQVEAYAQPLRSRDGRYALARSARQLVTPGAAEAAARLAGITVPTLLIWGERDRVVPPSLGERLAAVLPDATLVVLPDCGHMPQEEQPRESLEVLRRFLRER